MVGAMWHNNNVDVISAKKQYSESIKKTWPFYLVYNAFPLCSHINTENKKSCPMIYSMIV